MFELQPQDFGKIEPLIQDITHDVPIIYAMLEHNSPGRIWVDDVAAPTAAFIYPRGAFHYMVGQSPNGQTLSAVWELLQQTILPDIQNPADREVVLFALSDACRQPLATFMQTRRSITLTRKTFQFHADCFTAQRAWRAKLPAGMTMRPIDAEILEQGLLHDLQLDTWMSPQMFLSKGAGACLLHHGEVVSESATFFVGRGIAELSVHTQETYRGHGLATLTAAACIDMCLEKGLQPRWACWPEREASIALAQKLGFKADHDMPAYYWREHLDNLSSA